MAAFCLRENAGMNSLIQRVAQARVEVQGEVIGQIGHGLLVLVCAEQGDSTVQADKLLAKLLKLRIFGDENGKMNRSVQDVGGGLLLVSQFTLAADCTGGNRPSFTGAAAPEEGRRLYDYFVEQARAAHPVVATGRFATEMKVHLVNDGPITIPLRIQ
jgi:D-tyrosyl-tRNA(Tyr) deacylase